MWGLSSFGRVLGRRWKVAGGSKVEAAGGSSGSDRRRRGITCLGALLWRAGTLVRVLVGSDYSIDTHHYSSST